MVVMQAGDRVYCKRTLDYYFSVGEYYIITECDDNTISVGLWGGGQWNFNKEDFLNFNWNNQKIQCGWTNDFSNYFYTIKELRRLKLESLKDA